MSLTPDCIQAAAAVCLVILTAWTLKVLREYAADTKRIANDSASQAERSQKPFLAIVRTDRGYSIQNQGYGPAVNIVYRGFGNNAVPFTASVPSLAPGGLHPVHNEFGITFQQHREFSIEYESLSGQRYRT